VPIGLRPPLSNSTPQRWPPTRLLRAISSLWASYQTPQARWTPSTTSRTRVVTPTMVERMSTTNNMASLGAPGRSSTCFPQCCQVWETFFPCNRGIIYESIFTGNGLKQLRWRQLTLIPISVLYLPYGCTGSLQVSHHSCSNKPSDTNINHRPNIVMEGMNIYTLCLWLLQHIPKLSW